MKISKIDVLWNYGATFLKVASSALLFPILLRTMPSEMVGIYTIFITISAFAGLLDFGFNPSFARNVSYVFSGVKRLQINGYEKVENNNQEVDYGLLSGVIDAMKWVYMRMSLTLFFLLITFGSYYIHFILNSYSGDKTEVYIAWILLCLISTYNLYTLYFDSLLQGKGLIKKSKQFIIVGHLVYLFVASTLLLTGFGLIAIISAQIFSVVIIRWLGYREFFTIDIKQKLASTQAHPKDLVLKAITPNAIKIGLTSLGGFLVVKSAIIIGSLYLSLEAIASYGITMQIVGIIAGLGAIFTATYIPKIAQLRIFRDTLGIKNLYIQGQTVLFMTYGLCGSILIIFGESIFNLLGSQTPLVSRKLLFFMLILSLVESNLSMAGSILLTKNKVPFFKASLSSGAAIVLGLLLCFNLTNLGIWSMIIVPISVNLCYQAWKWPWEVKKDLDISIADYFQILKK